MKTYIKKFSYRILLILFIVGYGVPVFSLTPSVALVGWILGFSIDKLVNTMTNHVIDIGERIISKC